MARRRDFSREAARRNELARERGYASYYQERIARAKRAHPGISKGAARGHPSAQERKVNRLLRTIRKLPPDSQVAFTGIDRQPDGTWKTGRFDVLSDDGDSHFEIDADVLQKRITEIADEIADTGIAVIGARYMATMAKE